MTGRAWLLPAAAVACALAAVPDAAAHELQSAYLEMRETGRDTWQVQWRVPTRRGVRMPLEARLPEGCEPIGARQVLPAMPGIAGSMHAERWAVRCAGGIDGATVAIDGLADTLTDVVGRVVRADGRTQTLRVLPTSPSFVVEPSPSLAQMAGAYLGLGIGHIVLGVDHLLFVLGLLLIVRSRWMLFKTITAFTVAHSLTLAVATLGYASAPAVPLNAAIALSILFLGPEIVRARRGETSLTIRHPWVVAFAFGLLHGFGFASGLSTMGLPASEIPVALLLFNVGVEAGQTLFIGLVILLERSFAALEVRWPPLVEALPAWAVGSLGAFWTIERGAIVVRGVL